MSGYYLVYLFDSELKKVYLSLLQGFTYYKNKYNSPECYNKISETAKKYRSLLSNNPTVEFSYNIKLNPTRSLGKGYEHGHICGIEYDLYNLPDNKVLKHDLNEMLIQYKLLKSELDRNFYYKENSIDPYEDKVNLDMELSKPTIKNIIDKPVSKPEKRDSSTGQYKRNPNVALNSIIHENYECAISIDHKYFESRRMNENYVEAHHLIPMRYQDDFENSLDVEANVVSLCPVCHKILHHGVLLEIKHLLEILHGKRKERLKQCGLEITIEELIKLYKVCT